MSGTKSAFSQCLDWGWTEDELKSCFRHGWSAELIVAEIERLKSVPIDSGKLYCTDETARQTFMEIHPEFFIDSEDYIPEPEEDLPPRMARPAAQFQKKPHDFYWYPYIPAGDVTALVAPSGTGKTYIACWLLAQATKGGWLPGDADVFKLMHSKKPGPRNAMYISSEEDGGELRARLEACGADLEKVFILDKTDSLDMSFTDGFTEFKNTIKAYNPAIVIIDPVQAYLGYDLDVSKVNHVRQAMQKLAVIAHECSCAIVIIMHVNKKPQGENINNAAIGSTEFINTSRSALMITYSENPDENDTRVMVHTKQNYTPNGAGESIRFTFTAGGGLAYDGHSAITRALMEEAARERKPINKLMEEKQIKRDTSRKLIASIKELVKDAFVVDVAFEEMKDLFGEDIFGGAARYSMALKNCEYQLSKDDIKIEYKTASGKPKKKTYNGKQQLSFTIVKGAEQKPELFDQDEPDEPDESNE